MLRLSSRPPSLILDTPTGRDTETSASAGVPDSGYGTGDPHQHHQRLLRSQQSEPALTSSYSNPYTSTGTHTHRTRVNGHGHSHSLSSAYGHGHSPAHPDTRPPLRVNLTSVSVPDADVDVDQPISATRRQRRRLDTPQQDYFTYPYPHSPSTSSSPRFRSIYGYEQGETPHTLYSQGSHSHSQCHSAILSHPLSLSSLSQSSHSHSSHSSSYPHSSFTRRLSTSSIGSASSSTDEDGDSELTGAVGQLSLNEEEQVRYHGKASGLHLLGVNERVDARNEGGIWWVLVLFFLVVCEFVFFS
jgi:hypothetical protein